MLLDAHPPDDDPVHAQRAERENVQNTDRHVRDDHVDDPPRRGKRRREGHHRERNERGTHRQHRPQHEVELRGRSGERFFLDEVLEAIRDRLKQAERTDAIRAKPVLYERGNPPFGERRVGDGQHHQAEHDGDLE